MASISGQYNDVVDYFGRSIKSGESARRQTETMIIIYVCVLIFEVLEKWLFFQFSVLFIEGVEIFHLSLERDK